MTISARLHWFQRIRCLFKEVLTQLHKEKLPHPLGVMIFNGSNFVEGRPVIISTKLF